MNRKWTAILAFVIGVSGTLLTIVTYRAWFDSPPALAFEANEVSLGERAVGSTFPYEIRFRNTAGREIRIDNVEAGCSCANVQWPREPLASGAAATITLSIRVDRAGPARFQPRIAIAGAKEPTGVGISYTGVAALTPVEPVVYASRLVKDHSQTLSLRWVLKAPLPEQLQQAWHAETPAAFIELGRPRLVVDDQGVGAVEVSTTVLGAGAPAGLFRERVRLVHDWNPKLESTVLLVGMAEEESLLVEPRSVLAGRMAATSTPLKVPVQLQLLSGRAFEVADASSHDPFVAVQPPSGIAASQTVDVTIDPAKIRSAGRWSGQLNVVTRAGVRGSLRVFGFIAPSNETQSPRNVAP